MKLFLCLSLLPLAVYLCAVSLFLLRRRPLVVSGARDFNLLGLALAGTAVAGPLELFLPETAAFRFGPWVWGLMLSLYFLLVTMYSMMMRPRIAVYNLTQEELRPLLAELARRLDPGARWAGESLVLPKWDVRLHLENSPTQRNVQLVASGSDQADTGWRKLETELRNHLRNMVTERNPRGLQLLATAGMLAAIVGYLLVRDYPSIAASFRELLRI